MAGKLHFLITKWVESGFFRHEACETYLYSKKNDGSRECTLKLGYIVFEAFYLFIYCSSSQSTIFIRAILSCFATNNLYILFLCAKKN